MLPENLRIAIVHEWLVTFGGSELVLRELLRLFPRAQVFTLIDAMSPRDRQFIGVRDVRSSFLSRLPAARHNHRKFLPLFPAAVRSLDLSGYDLIISNSHAVAKGVRKRGDQLHLSYCLSPMRYAWDLREQYLAEAGIDRGITGLAAHTVLNALRAWDRKNTAGVDVFATLSHYVADRIQRAYGRTSTVIYPPVDVDFFSPGDAATGDYYVTASRFVPYKRVDLIARAFRDLPDRRLVIIGEGPDAEKVRAAAGPNVTLLGHVDREHLRTVLRGARAFIFAAEEDFGIAPLEAQACGIPVIAFGRGGATETIRGLDAARPTGVHFPEQSEASLQAAIRQYEGAAAGIGRDACRENAERFSEARFRDRFREFVEREWASYSAR